jgi:hypothetical protein
MTRLAPLGAAPIFCKAFRRLVASVNGALYLYVVYQLTPEHLAFCDIRQLFDPFEYNLLGQTLFLQTGKEVRLQNSLGRQNSPRAIGYHLYHLIGQLYDQYTIHTIRGRNLQPSPRPPLHGR